MVLLQSLHEICSSLSNFAAYLEGLFASMNQLMPLQFGTFHKCFATLRTDVHARAVCVQMLAHRRVVTEHLGATLQHKILCVENNPS